MKTRFTSLLIVFVLITATAWAEGQYEEKRLPFDPNVTIEALENGLTYYIRENIEPQDRAYLRLVVNAGSILEDSDQLGLAHMAEHMAFNGTEKYEKSQIIDYLESIGMRFGPEINAYTGFDETVYMLQVPTDDPVKLEKGFDILSQWAFHISFDDEEIDKERGVIVEEWRTGLGAQERLREKQFPVLFSNSQYAARLPIGKMEVIQSFEYDAIRRFYRDWYRPENMAVIAVGDFQSTEIKALITRYFGSGAANATTRPKFTVPDHDETLFAIASDPELPYTQVSVYNKGDTSTLTTEEEYRQMLVHRLYSGMINARFSESTRSANPPFLAAGSGRTNLVRPKGISYLAAIVEGNKVGPGLAALIEEAKRVSIHGFTLSELERAKKELLTGIKRSYTERDNAESDSYMQEYTRHFLEGEAAPGIENEYRLYNRLVPEIALRDVDGVAESYLAPSNRVIMVSAVEKEGLAPVDETALALALEQAEGMVVETYTDETADIPLLADEPDPGSISSKSYHDEVGITEWRLSNGAKVYLKPTDFKNDEIRFSAFSPGGTSLYDETDYLSALYATSLISESGIGQFSATSLDKKLTGQTVSVTPFIGTIEEGFRGRSSVEDAGTMFRLIYNYFTAPRRDEEAYTNLIRALETVAQNRESQPGRMFSDRIQEILTSGHYTAEPLTLDRVGDIDMNRAMEIYSERFADAGDFSFVFVGNISPTELEPYIKQYIASLPSQNTNESWDDVGIIRPTGVIADSVNAGIEPQSQVITIFHGDYTWSRENNHRLLSLTEALRIRLREVLREDESGTYGVSVRAGFERYPKERYTVQVYFGTSPDRAEELAELAMTTIKNFTATPPADLYLTKVRTTQQEQYELNIEENSYWLSSIKNAVLHGREFSTILDYPDLIDTLDAEDISKAAARYLDFGQYVRVILYPAAEE